MTPSTRIRPRTEDERRALSRILQDAPRVVQLDFEDDGWVAAQLIVSGRVPVWGGVGDSSRTERLLERLGLRPLGKERPQAFITADLVLKGDATATVGSLAAVEGPLVSILICTYNRVSLLPKALDSALMQNWPVEIIVVDDGSDDGTREWLSEQSGIRVIHQPQNGGKCHALNVGIAHANGAALLILDDDDQLMPGAVELLARTLFSSPEASVVFGDAILNREGHYFDWIPAMRGTQEREVTLLQVPGLTGAHLTRMSAQRQAGEFDLRLEQGEDMDMFLRLARTGRFLSVPFATFVCGIHPGTRGSAVNRHQKVSIEDEDRRTIEFAAPIFRERWLEYGAEVNRSEGFAWAMGLYRRSLGDEAHVELSRWAPPYNARELWIRQQCGLSSPPVAFEQATVVADDGDVGALESVLSLQPQDRSLWVNLQVPREPLSSVRLYWEGTYGAHEDLSEWVKHSGPIHLRLSSSPEWSPPPIGSLDWLPKIQGTDAILAVAAILGWDRPSLRRRVAGWPFHPIAVLAWSVRQSLEQGEVDKASRLLERMTELAPDWVGVQVLEKGLESLLVSRV